MKFSFKTQIWINMSNHTNHKRPTILQSVIPILVLIGLISLNVITLGDNTLSGANQISLLIASSVATCIALYNKVTWQDILKGILHTLSAAMPAILILMMIGALAGTWMLSGIIPAMIHYRLYILRPDYFLPAAVIIAAIIAIATGSSWSTIATVGVALLGIGQTLGLNDTMIAGAIISGAYFGDKVSPLSDTTNLASATAGVNLFTHIRYMMFTTVPTILITIILFTIISLCIDIQPTDMSVDAVQQTITSTYQISPLLFIVPIIVIWMIARRVEPVPVLFLGAILGAILALITQSDVITQLSGQETLTFKGAYRIITQAMYGSLSINNRESDCRYPFQHLGNGRHDEYHLADHYRHDFRRSHGGRTVPRTNHLGTDPTRTLHRRTGHHHNRYLSAVQCNRFGSIHRHCGSRQNVLQRLP